MHDFKVGDRVICVGPFYASGYPKENEICTIKEVDNGGSLMMTFLTLEEYSSRKVFANRFIPYSPLMAELL